MTFSVALHDPARGEFGVAVCTGVPIAPGLCMFVRAGVGAVLTQALVNPMHGPRVLDGLQRGDTAADAIAASLALDASPAERQVICVGAESSSDYTGGKNQDWAGSR